MRRTFAPVVVTVLVLVLAACAAGTVRDLQTLKAFAARGDLEAIVAHPVSCAPTTEGCAQARMIQADACLRRAQEVPVTARAPYAACAADGYEQALAAAAARPDPLVDPARLALAQLEATRAWRDAVTRADAARLNAQLAERADRVARTQAARPEGPYYLADARAWPAVVGLERPPCPAIQAAILLANEAAKRQAAGDVDVDQLRRDLGNAARAEGCDVAS